MKIRYLLSFWALLLAIGCTKEANVIDAIKPPTPQAPAADPGPGPGAPAAPVQPARINPTRSSTTAAATTAATRPAGTATATSTATTGTAATSTATRPASTTTTTSTATTSTTTTATAPVITPVQEAASSGDVKKLEELYNSNNQIFNDNNVLATCEFNSKKGVKACPDASIQFIALGMKPEALLQCIDVTLDSRTFKRNVLHQAIISQDKERVAIYLDKIKLTNLDLSCDGMSPLKMFYRGNSKSNLGFMSGNEAHSFSSEDAENIFGQLIEGLNIGQLEIVADGQTILSNSIDYLDVGRVQKIIKRKVNCNQIVGGKTPLQLALASTNVTEEIYESINEATMNNYMATFGLIKETNQFFRLGFGSFMQPDAHAPWENRFGFSYWSRNVIVPKKLAIFNELLTCADTQQYPKLFSQAASDLQILFLEALHKKDPNLVKIKSKAAGGDRNQAVFETIRIVLEPGSGVIDAQKSIPVGEDTLKTKILGFLTDRILKALQKLKEFGLSGEDFTKNILVDDLGHSIIYPEAVKTDGSGEWYFEKVRQKLLELAK